jgi:molecular chaperone GrpE
MAYLKRALGALLTNTAWHSSEAGEGERMTEDLNPTVEGAAETPDETTVDLQAELEKAQAEAADLLDKYRRGAAEFANYRKRQERERDNDRQRISMDVLRRLLPIVDDLALAMAHMPEPLAEDAWAQGMGLVLRKMEGLLTEFKATPIEALGKPFDPYYHSALMQLPSDTWPAGTVASEIQKGYMLGDQVLRPTLVAVSSGPANTEG